MVAVAESPQSVGKMGHNKHCFKRNTTVNPSPVLLSRKFCKKCPKFITLTKKILPNNNKLYYSIRKNIEYCRFLNIDVRNLSLHHLARGTSCKIILLTFIFTLLKTLNQQSTCEFMFSRSDVYKSFCDSRYLHTIRNLKKIV